MARIDFNVNDSMINTVRVYQKLKDKRLKEHNVKSAKNDEYIKTITTNAFKMLAAELPEQYLKNGSIDYTQWRWIWDIAMNRNKRIFTRERHGKTQLVYHKMETPHTVQGKDSSPEIDHHAEIHKSIPVYENDKIQKGLEQETKHSSLEGFNWEKELELEERVKESIKLANHLLDKVQSEVIDE